MNKHIPELDAALNRLDDSIVLDLKDTTKHRRWSHFIRSRDRFRCLICTSGEKVEAHHIIRKSLIPSARGQPGNGITLCNKCHREAHRGFNGRPDLQQPIDAEDGEKLNIAGELLGVLARASRTYPSRPIYYHWAPRILANFAEIQGFPRGAQIPGTPIEQAHLIWDRAPLQLMDAVIESLIPGLKYSDRFAPVT